MRSCRRGRVRKKGVVSRRACEGGGRRVLPGGRVRKGAVVRTACEGGGRREQGSHHHGGAEPGGAPGARAGCREGREGVEAPSEGRGAAGAGLALPPDCRCWSRGSLTATLPPPWRAGRGIAAIDTDCGRLCLTEGAAAAELNSAWVPLRPGGRGTARKSYTLTAGQGDARGRRWK